MDPTPERRDPATAQAAIDALGMRIRRRVVPVLAVVAFVTVGMPGRPAGATSPPIVLILMENHEYGSVIGDSTAPYINRTLVANGLLATDYHANFHPSLPNYLAITSGSNDGCRSDSCRRRSVSADNLFNQLGLQWKAYEQSMPSSCDLSDA